MSKYIIYVPDPKNKFDFGTVTPYVEPDLDAIRKEAYDEGYKEGMQLSIDDAKLKEEYQRGLNDAWECARKIGSNSMCSLKEMGFEFGQCGVNDYNPSWFVVKNYSISEAIEKLKAYEQECEEIKPGDEFENGSGQRFVVLSKRNKEIYRYIDGAGRSYVMKVKYNTIRKTGRSFPEVVNMLKELYQPAADQEEKTAYEIRIQKLRDRLTEFCRKQDDCANCPLNTNEFSCGKGFSFKRMYDDDEKIIPEHDIEAYAVAAGLACGSEGGLRQP